MRLLVEDEEDDDDDDVYDREAERMAKKALKSKLKRGKDGIPII